MRSQNPPYSHLQKARDIEKVLRPAPLAAVYLVSAFSYFAAVSLLFVRLMDASILSSGPMTIAIASVFAFVPSILLLLAWFLRPDDPLSNYLIKQIARWSSPIPVSADPCTFRALLSNGDTACIGLSFYYPQDFQSMAMKERLYSCAYAALGRGFSTRATPPTNSEIEEMLDFAAETVAAEFSIPVLYMEATSVTRIRDTHSPWEDGPVYAATGTLG